GLKDDLHLLAGALDLDGAWEFRLDPASVGEAEGWNSGSASFPDAIQVPGAWDAQGFGGETPKMHHSHVGKGWYRRTVDIPADWQGRRLFLCFGGVYRSAKVWVNGEFAGAHLGYVSDFEFEITPHAVAGQPCRIVVLVDSEQRWTEDALQGCMDIIDHLFTYWGGIWSHVTLESRSTAWLCDVFVEPRTDPAGCVVQAVVAGDSSLPRRAEVAIFESDGAPIASRRQDIGPDGTIRVDLELPGARLWTPEEPHLCTAQIVLSDEACSPIDETRTRFGLRTIEIRDSDFYVNGVKYYLNGYGDDCVYPDTIAPPADKQLYLDRLRVAKSYGFNFVRHHSHFVAPEYYEACDEVGMFVSPELPIAYPRFYNRAHGAALELYASEWSAVIKRYRNHPSIFDWCMANELWEGMPRIGPELYRIAKELDPTRPVIDSDGIFAGGFADGTKDRPTLDFYAIMFDILTTPLDNPDKFTTGTPRKPIITHEEGNFVHFPLFDEIELFGDTIKPLWITDCRDRVARAGLLDEAPAWSKSSQQLYLLCHKANIEALRKNPCISGYTWWLLQPWYCGSNGLLDVHRRPISVTPGQVRRFNAPAVLLQDGLRQTYAGGDVITVEITLSNYSGKAVEPGRLTCTLMHDDQILDSRVIQSGAVPNGSVEALGEAEFTLPDAAEPQRLSLQAALEDEEEPLCNDWTLWVYPDPPPAAPPRTPVYASPDTMALLAAFQPQALPDGARLPSRAVYVARQPSEALVAAAERGSCVVLLSPAGVFPTDCTTFKSAWWLGVFDGDSNAGTYVYDNPVTRGLTPDHWCDASWFHLLQGAQTLLLDDLPAQPEVLIRALNTHGAPHPFSQYLDFEYVWRNKAVLAQARVGKGSIIISGLNFDVAARNGGPEAAYVLSRLIEHACELPRPDAKWSGRFLKSAIQSSAFANAPLVSGFTRLRYHKGVETQAQSYRERSATALQIRQEEPLHRLEWESAPMPGAPKVTFVFAGGFPFMEPPLTNPGFTLAVNGQPLVDFDTSKTQTQWPGRDGRSALLYVPGHVQPSWSYTAGLFYLTVPRDVLVPGQPCRLEVRSRGSDNRRYFNLNPYTDIFFEPQSQPWRSE
ncbi:MAG TPA: glycoside hydrolase family 2 TIM barrel-domain containing protein, partial [Candidatus Hydrogenedentes bacterium]|nr:glycoside hydrolase family 2 TIM barrel-domain containing protein [Candidatus Hydrogenedentota bacterium]